MTKPSVSARIVFDLDGTLVDSAPDIWVTANLVLAREQAAPLTLEETRSFIGHGAAVFVSRICESRNLPAERQPRMLADFMSRYDKAVSRTFPYMGVRPSLLKLHLAGHRMGVCTNKPLVPAHAVLSHLKLERFFGTVIGGDSLPVRKPDPAPLDAAFEALGSGPMIYVGDSEVDAETAERLGVPFLLYTEGYRKTPVEQIPHTVSFSHFSELTGLVDVLLKG